MLPVVVAAILPLLRRGRLTGIALQPVEDVVVIALPVPQHAGQRLPLHASRILVVQTGVDAIIEFVCFLHPIGEYLLEIRESVGRARGSRPHAHTHCCVGSGCKSQADKRRSLGPYVRGIHSLLRTVNHILVKCVFEISFTGTGVEDATRIGFVLSKQEFLWQVEVELVRAERRMRCAQSGRAAFEGHFRLDGIASPTPGVAKPDVR